MSLIKSSKNLLVLWKDYGINIQKLSTLPNIQRSGRMNNVEEILNTFNNQDIQITEKKSETQEFKKLQMRAVSLGNS